jgi:hypothetical protein
MCKAIYFLAYYAALKIYLSTRNQQISLMYKNRLSDDIIKKHFRYRINLSINRDFQMITFKIKNGNMVQLLLYLYKKMRSQKITHDKSHDVLSIQGKRKHRD